MACRLLSYRHRQRDNAVKKIIIIVVGVLVLLLGGGAGVYFLKPDLLPEAIRPLDKDAAHANAEGEEEKAGGETKDKKKKAGKKDEHAREASADLDVFVVNLAGAGAPRYLRTMLSLGIKDEHDKEKIKELSGKIRHAVIMYLSERKAEELGDPAGKNKLREELQKQIAEAIDDDKLVTNVYFKEFLIQ
jgi:flagellar FliL protein